MVVSSPFVVSIWYFTNSRAVAPERFCCSVFFSISLLCFTGSCRSCSFLDCMQYTGDKVWYTYGENYKKEEKKRCQSCSGIGIGVCVGGVRNWQGKP